MLRVLKYNNSSTFSFLSTSQRYIPFLPTLRRHTQLNYGRELLRYKKPLFYPYDYLYGGGLDRGASPALYPKRATSGGPLTYGGADLKGRRP